jgi:hypothetical protein
MTSTLPFIKGADPNLDLGWLRATTPLHEASTVRVALLLLSFGARSAPSENPREPPPQWYHTHRGRPEVADAIREWRRDHAAPVQQFGPLGLGFASQGIASGGDGGVGGVADGNDPRVMFPGLSVKQLRCALERFRHEPVLGARPLPDKEDPSETTTNPLLSMEPGGAAASSNEEPECPICFELLSLPPPRPSLSSRNLTRLLQPQVATPSSRAGCDDGAGGLDGLANRVLATPCNDDRTAGPAEDEIAAAAAQKGTDPSQETHPPRPQRPAPRPQPEKHLFHAAGLVDWLHRSCRCPLCKADLRPHLRE